MSFIIISSTLPYPVGLSELLHSGVVLCRTSPKRVHIIQSDTRRWLFQAVCVYNLLTQFRCPHSMWSRVHERYGVRLSGPTAANPPGTSAGFWLGEGASMPPCCLRRRKCRKFDYKMVHSKAYLNKYVVSIAPFSTPACPDCSQNIT